MIRIIAEFPLKEGKFDEALEIAKQLIDATRKEEGCVEYLLAQSPEKAEQVVIIEAWESQSALDAHSASAHFAALVPKLAAFCEKDPAVRVFQQVY